ncbi:hypothetical protein JB92DRAFT_252411 [Gautieria morchelliformis]|nr:hypothetical protein JB92DRAFT_252411 [Gautieria morchelliformis]
MWPGVDPAPAATRHRHTASLSSCPHPHPPYRDTHPPTPAPAASPSRGRRRGRGRACARYRVHQPPGCGGWGERVRLRRKSGVGQQRLPRERGRRFRAEHLSRRDATPSPSYDHSRCVPVRLMLLVSPPSPMPHALGGRAGRRACCGPVANTGKRAEGGRREAVRRRSTKDAKRKQKRKRKQKQKRKRRQSRPTYTHTRAIQTPPNPADITPHRYLCLANNIRCQSLHGPKYNFTEQRF